MKVCELVLGGGKYKQGQKSSPLIMTCWNEEQQKRHTAPVWGLEPERVCAAG